jgi:hypothetical protein
MKVLTVILSLIAVNTWAGCYVVGDIEGYSTRLGSDFTISNDALSGQKFIVEIAGDKSSVTPNSMGCTQMGANVLVCFDQKTGGQISLETWAIHPEEGKVVYTKANHGYGQFDGANLMVGSIKGSCE